MAFKLPFRQIHLDFHTGPAIPDVGRDFDADTFADTMKEAHVNSVTVFAKCHHGHLYYNTKHPARHPSLKKSMDLLGEQVEALHKRGIRAPIYISVQCDEFAANTHPEWRVVNPDGRLAGNPLHAGWHIVDMSSPYADYLAEQIEEVMKLFKPVDGVFLDMCWDQPSVSTWALDKMVKGGYNPDSEEDRGNYAHALVLEYMTRYKKIIDGAQKGKPAPVWFNSRPLWNFDEEKKFFMHAEIEALPTGGWGYTYFPLGVRFVRTFGLPCLGMTGRFHKSWADFGGLKPEAALMYECCQMLANGARCSVGDQLHPRGVLDTAVYDMIGKVYKHVEKCEPWCEDAVAVSDIGVMRAVSRHYHSQQGDANEGAVRALQQLGCQFDFVSVATDFAAYKLIVVPEGVTADAALATKLQAYLKKGGAVLFSGSGALDADGKPVLPEQGIQVEGPSPFTTTYLRFDGEFGNGIPATDHVMYERGFRMTAAKGAKGFVTVVEPYFEREWRHFSSHFQTPPDKASKYMAVVQNGKVMTIAFPVFKAYGTHGNLAYRHLIAKCVAHLLPEPVLRIKAPSFVEVNVNRQGKSTVVHLLGYCPIRRGINIDIVEEAVTVPNIALALKLPKAPSSVTLQPEGKALKFTYRSGHVEVTVPELNGHAMVVVE